MKKVYLYWFAIVIAFLFTRLIGIDKIPIFNDEMLYMRWIQEIQDGYFMRPLDNGRQPLYLWLATVLDYIVHDESLSLRYVSVAAGFISMMGLWFLTKILFKNSTVSFITIALYIIFPFTLLYDRLGVLDSMVTALAIWSFNFSVLLLRNPKYLYSVTLGVVMGLGLLTKSNALFSLILLPMTQILIMRRISFREVTKSLQNTHFIKWVIYALLAIGIAKIIELLIVMQPNYFRILGANGIFIYPVKEWIVLPIDSKIDVFVKNLIILGTWLYEYMGLLLIILISNLFFYKNYKKERILLFIYFAVPFIVLCFFGRVMFPRYILPMVIFLFPLCAFSIYQVIVWIRYSALRVVVISLFFLPVFINAIYVLFDYQKSTIPITEKRQYFIDSKIYSWVRENVQVLATRKSDDNVLIYIDESAMGFESIIEHGIHQQQHIKIVKSNDKVLSQNSAVYVFTMNMSRYQELDSDEYGFSKLSNGTVLYILKTMPHDNP